MDDEDIEDAGRLTGTVIDFNERRGFGFIRPQDAADEKIFCHWKDVQTDDQWPQLVSDMVVEYSVKQDDNGKPRAENVTLVGGGKISVEEAMSGKKYDTSRKYTGVVKFFDLKKGFGFVLPDLASHESISWEGVTMDRERGLYIAREDIFTNDVPPALNDDSKVEFQVYHGPKGLGAGRVCDVGGGKIVFKRPGFESQKRGRDYVDGFGFGPKRGKPLMDSWQGFRPMAIIGDNMEVGLFVENSYVGSLIGKGGATVREMRESTGANIQFDDSRLQRRIVSLVGTTEQVQKACHEISKRLAEFEADGRPSLIFLIPDSKCGVFIGKKGSNLKEIREHSGVRVNVASNPMQLPTGALVSIAEVKGTLEEIEKAMEKVIPTLGRISQRVIQEQMMGQMGFIDPRRSKRA